MEPCINDQNRDKLGLYIMESYINGQNRDKLGLYIVKKEAKLEGLSARRQYMPGSHSTSDSLRYKIYALKKEIEVLKKFYG